MKQIGSLIFLHLLLFAIVFIIIAQAPVAEASTITVNQDQTVSIDGKPFFPIGAYCIGDKLPQEQGQWQEVFTWKLNLDSSPFVPEMAEPSLAICENFSAYCHLSVGYADAYKNRDLATITNNVNKLKGSSYIFGYGLPDEPPAQGLTPQDTEFGYNTIKNADPNHPVLLTYYQDFDLFKNSADIFILDFYPYQLSIPREKALYWLKDWYNQVAAQVSPKPVWSLVQTFGTPDDPTFYFFLPTNKEIRAEAYLALILGSKAIIYYAYDCEKYNINNQPHMKAFLKSLTGELQELSPIFLAQNSSKLSYSSGDVDAILKEYNRELYLIAVNKNVNNVTASFTIQGISNATATTIGKSGAGSNPERTITISGGKLTDTFEGLAANVYEITTSSSSSGFDFSLSLNSTSGSITQGSGIGTEVIATLTNGTAQPVSLSCSNAPSGATCSFNPSSVNPTASSELTLSTLNSTPTGTYRIGVVGTGGGITRTVNYSLNISSQTMPATYPATFSQSGISRETTWGVTIGGSRYTTTNSNITVSNLSGKVSYSYDSMVLGMNGTRYWCIAGCSGSVSSSATISATYITQS